MKAREIHSITTIHTAGITSGVFLSYQPHSFTKEEKMSGYKLYWVGQGKIKPGKFAEAAAWWREKGAPDTLSLPWTKSLKCYGVQFGLGGEYDIEIWQEIGSYGVFDEMDEFYSQESEDLTRRIENTLEGLEYIEWGPSRLMGDWPESSI